MTITMVVGSFVAGSTTLGGGAVAFPVMTLLLSTTPASARDFALMIQTIGMGAATFTIVYTRISIVHGALLWTGLGGLGGMVLGLRFLDGLVPPTYIKMFFVTAELSFAACLYWINRRHGRTVREGLGPLGRRDVVELVATGLVGGVMVALTGTGLNTIVFALLVLRFRISEKVATPTAVIVMAGLAAFGFAWKGWLMADSGLWGGGLAADAWRYWWAAVPAVVVGAPIGARFIVHRSRFFVAGLHYLVIGAQALAAFLILPLSSGLLAFGGAIFLAGLAFFRWMAGGPGAEDRLSEEAAVR